MHNLGPKKKKKKKKKKNSQSGIRNANFYLEIEIITRLGKTKPTWYKGQAALWKKAMGVARYTVWKLQKFSVTHIFREIKVAQCRDSKSF